MSKRKKHSTMTGRMQTGNPNQANAPRSGKPSGAELEQLQRNAMRQFYGEMLVRRAAVRRPSVALAMSLDLPEIEISDNE